MAFGLSQIKHPTPTNINLLARIITVTLSIFLGWMQTTDLIPTHAASVISAVIGLVLALVNGLAPLFGAEITTATVPSENVSAIDTPTKTNSP